MAGSPITLETRRRLADSDPKWPAKAILRLIGIPFAFLAMCFFAASISYTNANFINTAGNGDWTDGLALAPIMLSLIYNPVVLVLLFIVRRGKHIHPGWSVGAELVIWGLCIPAMLYAVAGGMFWLWQSQSVTDDDGNVDCGFFFNEWARQCNPIAYTIGNLEIAGIVFLFLIFVIHFTLFVFACIDTHKWRMADKTSMKESRNIQLQYHRDPEEHTANSPPAYQQTHDKDLVKETDVPATKYS
ncbi:hypothetical protein MMC09_001598 [Bachmanniomyces sp. S44760]|nr:hypothetical protein [Bachmanniomyces sp. S44760]